MPNPVDPTAGIVLENPNQAYGLPNQDAPDLNSGTLHPVGDWGGGGSTVDQVVYVSASGSDTNNGLSWGSAKATIGAALALVPLGGRVQLGHGNFTHSTGLAPVTATTIEGVGSDINGLTQGTRITFTGAAGYGWTATGANRVTLRDLAVVVTNAAAAGAFDFGNTSYNWTLENVEIYGASASAGTALYMHGQVSCCCYHNFVNVNISRFGTGIKLSGFANANYFRQVTIAVCNVWAIDISPDGTDTYGGSSNTFIRCEIDGSSVNGLNVATSGASEHNTFIRLTMDGVSTIGLHEAGRHSTYINCIFIPGGWSVTSDTADFINCTNGASGFNHRISGTVTFSGDLIVGAGNLVIGDSLGAAGLTFRTSDVMASKEMLLTNPRAFTTQAAGSFSYFSMKDLQGAGAHDYDSGVGSPVAGYWYVFDHTAGKYRLLISAGGSVITQHEVVDTAATDGFLYIPTCAGPPTGVPTTQTGTVALIWDKTNKKLNVYDGAWLGQTAPGVFS